MEDFSEMRDEYHFDSNKAITNHFSEPAIVFADSSLVGVAAQCRAILEQFYGTQLKRIILFGSSARQEADSESDIDLLVVLEKPFDYFKELRRIVDLLYPIQLESARLISALPAASDEYERGIRQLYRNIQRDGVTL